MSDDNLEDLDNVLLRKKCIEYGLPNVPITETSRKLMIRRLRAAIADESADKKKNRRKAIHVSKISAPVEAEVVVEEAPKRPPSRINRRTIAATSVTSTVDDTTLPAAAKPAPINDRRRSVRSQVEQEAPVSIPVSQKRKTAAVLEEEDDDDVILLEAAEERERNVVIPRMRRSVSLSKTGVVTTSYSQEKAVTPPTVNETESESENDFAANYIRSYDPPQRPISPPKPRETSYGLSQRKVVVQPERTSSLRVTTVNRTSIEPEPMYKAPPPTSRYSSLGSGFSANTESNSTTTTRRFTTGGYGAAPVAATKYTNVYAEEEDDNDQEEATPYLSDFARRLDRLKAEPFVKGVESPRNIPIKLDTSRYQSSIVGRRGTAQTSVSIADSFKDFLLALDRKYQLKRNLAILFAVILLLFIYVVFIH